MRPRCGFTLVELLVAMAVAAAVVTLTGIALHAGFLSWARLSSGSSSDLETVRLIAELERDVASALPMLETGFSGTPEACEIPRLRPARGGIALPVLVRWSYDPETATALREERGLLPSDSPEPAPRTSSFQPVPRPRFSYAPPPQEPTAAVPAWQEAWVSPGFTNLPASVRVDLGSTSRILPCMGVRR